jgi:hypothetical protein
VKPVEPTKVRVAEPPEKQGPPVERWMDALRRSANIFANEVHMLEVKQPKGLSKEDIKNLVDMVRCISLCVSDNAKIEAEKLKNASPVAELTEEMIFEMAQQFVEDQKRKMRVTT